MALSTYVSLWNEKYIWLSMKKLIPSHFTNRFHLKSLFQTFLYLIGIQCLIYYFKAYFHGRFDLNILFRVFLASPSLQCQFFCHCLFGDWSQALPPSCSFCDPLVLWRSNSGLPLLQSSSLNPSHDSILCILWFIPACLWETVKVSVIFLSSLKQHSDTEAILHHSRWLTSQESCEENLMILFARLQGTGTLTISSVSPTFVGHPIPWEWEFIF